jgi:hypothetical protein
MNETFSLSSDNPMPSSSELLKSVTVLCNEMDELIMLHAFYYQAAECVFNDKEWPALRGLSLFPQWLHERDTQALNSVHAFQQALRSACQQCESGE